LRARVPRAHDCRQRSRRRSRLIRWPSLARRLCRRTSIQDSTMRTTLSDLRLAVRGLRRTPLFASVAILSLALGIGANTAIFTLIDQILLRKLPVKEPDQVVMLYQQANNMGSNMGMRMNS